MGNLAAAGVSEGMAWLMVAGGMFILMGVMLFVLIWWNGRPERRRARRERARATAAADRAHAAVLRAQARRDRAVARDGRRTRKGAPWSSTGMNVLLLLLIMAPYADRLTLGV